ncbi:hypothetical protein EcWSU1_04412 [Enterobacter ludwigii]|uniref:Uncharacterized protein n=1 Tax=Enterobacter ludwigii TaxID=299767 RepID=G8LKZ7_9ENTR|nr:hypothetical protein EcWSU1_04412 [Enterobacter ludwigii]
MPGCAALTGPAESVNCLRQNTRANRRAVKQRRELLRVAPGGDVHRTSKRTRGIQRRIDFDDHAVGNNALLDKLFGFRRGHFRNTLAFAVENTAYVREQNQVRAQRSRQSRCRLVCIDVHQFALFGHPDRAHHRQESSFQQHVNQLRRTRLCQSNVSELFVELGHFYAVTIAQTQTDRGDMVFLRPRQQRFVRRPRQGTGNNINLVSRRDAQAIFLFHRQVEPFHQLINHAAAAVHNHQRTLV